MFYLTSHGVKSCVVGEDEMVENVWRNLFTLSEAKTFRVSSWDKRGMNDDYITVKPGGKQILAEVEGAGIITHMYCAMIDPHPRAYREIILRMRWDQEETPSVEVPIGDFFCIGNCTPRPVRSLMMVVNPGGKNILYTHGLNCYFPMPFSKGALIEIEYQICEDRRQNPINIWYHIEVEKYPDLPGENIGRFHAQWRREYPTKVVGEAAKYKNITTGAWQKVGVNLDGKENYLILEAEGKGQVVGLLLNVDNIAGEDRSDWEKPIWWGEGDDMIFIDGEKWPPSYHGTGTEEIFGGGASANVEYTGPYTGFHLVENKNGIPWLGKTSMYRWYINDPIRFQKSIRMSIEHGHANNFENDYSSVAYWYQIEPHKRFPELPSVKDRIPIGF